MVLSFFCRLFSPFGAKITYKEEEIGGLRPHYFGLLFVFSFCERKNEQQV